MSEQSCEEEEEEKAETRERIDESSSFLFRGACQVASQANRVISKKEEQEKSLNPFKPSPSVGIKQAYLLDVVWTRQESRRREQDAN